MVVCLWPWLEMLISTSTPRKILGETRFSAFSAEEDRNTTDGLTDLTDEGSNPADLRASRSNNAALGSSTQR